MFLAGTMETGQRIDTLTVPFLAIRETVLNMLAHRSWWDESESLSVAIFDDRIEFTNPGHFPIGTSVEDFIETPRSKPQNPDIANVLFRSGWMESWGRGIANIMDACEQAGLPKPKIVETAANVTVVLYNGKTVQDGSQTTESTTQTSTKTTLTTTQKILALMEDNPNITIDEIATSIGITRDGVNYQIRKLKDLKKIERVGGDFGGHWEVVKK